MHEKRSVVIITNTHPAHKHFCVEMSHLQNVVAILHPGDGVSRRVGSRVDRLRKKIKERGIFRLIPDQINAHPYISSSRRHGALTHLLHHITRYESKHLGWNRIRATREAERVYFGDASVKFNETLSDISNTMDDINSEQTISTLSDINPDVVICLGGPIYRPPLIDSCRLMLNFHTGISPIYNGTGTIYWCFANGHLHLSGGTLMTMRPEIDGGNILGHYLPSIESSDDPARLSARCIYGAVTMYDNFLNWYWSNGSFSSINQSKPFFYYRGFEWNITQNLAIERLIKKGACEKFKRDEIIYEYWKERNNEEAERKLKKQITDFLFYT